MPSNQTKPIDHYRADIDGIRAIAVLAVIIFHINKSILPGGFVGVDIFFVISGYLITLHILRDLNLNKFSIIEFYKRRVKRIAPVMLVVVGSVVLVSLLIQRPEDTMEVTKTSIAALLSLANVYFWLFQDSGYFAQASNEIPLLHLWSLGVEEQFYIFWPLMLIGLYRGLRGKHFVVIFVIVAAFSFLLGQYLYPKFPSFVYYMLPTRMGELLVGGLAAYTVTKKANAFIPSTIVLLASIVGFACISISIFYLSEDFVFPGLYALLPTIGTALLILSGHYGNSGLKKLLMIRPLVFIGLISYSAYLWHWPLLSFAHYSGFIIDVLNGIIIFVLTIILSMISYYLVECPTRRYKGNTIKVFSYLYIVPSMLLLFFCLLVYKTDGLFTRNNPDIYGLTTDKVLPTYRYNYVCQQFEITNKEINNSHCVIGEPINGSYLSPHALLWGDSNAAHYIGVIGTFAKEAEFGFKNLQHSSCPPIFSDPADFVLPKRVEKCRKSLHRMRDVLEGYEVVIISSSWTSYQSRSELFLPVFFKTVKALRESGKLVILLGKVPNIDSYDRTCEEKAIFNPFIKCNGKAEMPENIIIMNERLKKFAAMTDGVEYFDIMDYLCTDKLCSAYDSNGEPLYFDSSHLSMSGSWKIGKEIVARLSGVPYPFTLIKEIHLY